VHVKNVRDCQCGMLLPNRIAIYLFISLVARPLNSSSKVMSVLVPILSQILHSWLQGIFLLSTMSLNFLSRLRYRHMEDFVTWVDTSKLKRTIMQYNDEVLFNLFYFHCSLTPSIAGRFRSVIEFILETKPMA
jgi:hypothetical protein